LGPFAWGKSRCKGDRVRKTNRRLLLDGDGNRGLSADDRECGVGARSRCSHGENVSAGRGAWDLDNWRGAAATAASRENADGKKEKQSGQDETTTDTRRAGKEELEPRGEAAKEIAGEDRWHSYGGTGDAREESHIARRSSI
jgi:hypothetical protein